MFANSSEQEAGISIAGAEGVYVQNCTLSGSVSSGHGLYLSGATNVFVDHCDLSENPYALGAVENCNNVYVEGCNLNHSALGALDASSPGTLQITNSPGYNDQGAVLAGLPHSGIPFNATYFDYYGPFAFYTTSKPTIPVTEIEVNASATFLTAGGFMITAPAPDGSTYAGATATLDYGTGSPGGPYFLAVGK